MGKDTVKKIILPAILVGAAVIAAAAAIFIGMGRKESYRLIKVNSFDGSVTVQREEKMNAFEGLQLISEDSVEIGAASFLELLADSDKHIGAEENTGFVVHSAGTDTAGSITIDLLYGKALFTIDNKLNDESTFEVKTPNATLSVRGTVFSVDYDAAARVTTAEVTEGTVHVSYDGGEMLLEKGDKAVITVNDDIMEVVQSYDGGNNENNGNTANTQDNESGISDTSEKLFNLGMTYAQNENYAENAAKYQLGLSEYTISESGINDGASLMGSITSSVNKHKADINKYFEENKESAINNENKPKDVTEWFEKTFSIGGGTFRVDKATMDIMVSASSMECDYFTSDTYKVMENGREMYYCASGVVFEFFGEAEEMPEVTAAAETTVPSETTEATEATTTEITTTVTENTTVTSSETTAVTTTTASETTAPKVPERRMKKVNNYTKEGKLRGYTVCEYDPNGKWKKEYFYDLYYYKEGEQLRNTLTTEYDENGREIRLTSVDYYGDVSWSANEYDSKGNKVKQLNYYKDTDRLIHWFEYEYDANGNNIKSTEFREDKSIVSVLKSEYDSNGKLIKQASYQGNGELLHTKIYEYNGNITVESMYLSDGSYHNKAVYENDEYGNVIKSTHYEGDGSMLCYFIYEYE